MPPAVNAMIATAATQGMDCQPRKSCRPSSMALVNAFRLMAISAANALSYRSKASLEAPGA
jgi:hypothetical protein